jgi:hypothetical protein
MRFSENASMCEVLLKFIARRNETGRKKLMKHKERKRTKREMNDVQKQRILSRGEESIKKKIRKKGHRNSEQERERDKKTVKGRREEVNKYKKKDKE